MKQPTRAQQVGWVVLLTALGVLAAVRIGCGEASTASLAPEVMQADGGRG